MCYAICKNEEKFVSRWVESMKEADKIFVLDTGPAGEIVNFADFYALMPPITLLLSHLEQM